MKTAPFSLIQGIVVDHSLFTQPFACDLSTCHRACCWQGDAGAPLEPQEAETLQHLYPKLAPHFSQAGRNQVAAKGTSYRYRGKHRTTVLDFGLCAYARIQEDGIIRCGIQQAYHAGAVDFEKPISCHLYPLRRRRNWLGMEYPSNLSGQDCTTSSAGSANPPAGRVGERGWPFSSSCGRRSSGSMGKDFMRSWRRSMLLLRSGLQLDDAS